MCYVSSSLPATLRTVDVSRDRERDRYRVVADTHLASQLAEIGVMLLMFGVGLHFSLGDLLAVRKIAVPGAVVQMVAATAMGMGIATLWGWSLPAFPGTVVR